MGEKKVSLPEPGAGVGLEDYIAALFQASGHFVEKQIVESDPADVLELDIFATDYVPGKIVRRLVEVKGGRWGYTDLFKVVGWMRYLNVQRGAFFVRKWDDRTTAPSRMKPLGLDVLCLDDFVKAPELFESAGFGSFSEQVLIDVWRSSYFVERQLVQTILTHAKAGVLGAREARTYYNLINNGTFFARTPEESLGMLYDAFKSHPRLTLGYAREIDSGTFDPHSRPTKSASCSAALRDGKYPELQACMYFEHRARLTILKAAVDYALGNHDCPPSLLSDNSTFDGLSCNSLPVSFQEGMSWLRRQPNFHRYATFWQQLLWGWGGFYLQDRQDEEFEWMSTHSGIPADEIPVALKAFDRFFPRSGGWFRTPKCGDLRMLIMFPMVFQGIGAAHRFVRYEHRDSRPELEAGSLLKNNHLAKWFRCTYEFLCEASASTRSSKSTSA